MATAALVLYLLGLAVVFGLRTWVQIRRTGSAGWNGVSGRPGSLRWFAGILFIASLVLAVGALALAATGILTAPVTGPVGVAGLVVAVAGFVGVVLAQSGMGTSWRIGVAESERTELVTGGVFAAVRNPIFSAMVAAQIGFAVLVPTWSHGWAWAA